jgi:hypothetical protein
VNGQTAWNLLRIAETHDVSIVTALDEDVVSKMRLRKTTPEAVTTLINNKDARGSLMPAGAKLHVKAAT